MLTANGKQTTVSYILRAVKPAKNM